MELISKDDVIKALQKWNCRDYDSLTINPYEVLRDIPTIEEREEGHWTYYMNQYFICSNCGAKVLIPDNGSALVPEQDEYRFCPVCGARMKGE